MMWRSLVCRYVSAPPEAVRSTSRIWPFLALNTPMFSLFLSSIAGGGAFFKEYQVSDPQRPKEILSRGARSPPISHGFVIALRSQTPHRMCQLKKKSRAARAIVFANVG